MSVIYTVYKIFFHKIFKISSLPRKVFLLIYCLGSPPIFGNWEDRGAFKALCGGVFSLFPISHTQN